MVGKYKVITLCGSTRFKDAFMEAQRRLTLEGNIVISVGLFGHSGDDEVWADGTKKMLDDMRKRQQREQRRQAVQPVRRNGQAWMAAAERAEHIIPAPERQPQRRRPRELHGLPCDRQLHQPNRRAKKPPVGASSS